MRRFHRSLRAVVLGGAWVGLAAGSMSVAMVMAMGILSQQEPGVWIVRLAPEIDGL
nr:hypothetical protein [Tanacetum cinerariifolium]